MHMCTTCVYCDSVEYKTSHTMHALGEATRKEYLLHD